MTKKNNNQKGFSLIEMIVAVTLFSLVMILTTTIFQNAIKGQINSVAAQNTQESMRFAFEMMSKEIRTAQKSDHECEGFDVVGNVATHKVYNFDATPSALFFKNKNGECVAYYTEVDDNGISRLKIVRDNGVDPVLAVYITPDEVSVTDFNVIIEDDAIGVFHSLQPNVTIRMDVAVEEVNGAFKNKITMQTTVSSRYYE